MRIALLQMRSTLGKVQENCAKILASLEKAAQQKVDLLVTPEQALIGYPCDDLLSFQFILHQEKLALDQLKAKTKETGVGLLVGHTELAPGRWFYNSASLYESGELAGTIRKKRLPSYNIFNEARHFIPFVDPQKNLLFRGKRLGVCICEDDWDNVNAYGSLFQRSHPPPSPALGDERRSCDIHINLSASPFERGKSHLRDASFEELAKTLGRPVLWVNRVGGQDEIIFDGQSRVYDLLASVRGKSFEEDFLIWDDQKRVPAPDACTKEETRHNYWREIENALVLGIHDFVRGSGAEHVLLGLSGGIDSALVAYLCTKALGAQKVQAIMLASEITSDFSKQLAHDFAARLGLQYKEISMENPLHDLARSLEIRPSIAYENLQSRMRGLILMAESNRTGSLLMACGNKSELAMGYATIYGDMAGAMAPIGDLLKTDVYALCHFINLREKVFPENLLKREPTAELAPGQKDSDSLPHYALLDSFLHEVLEKQGAAFIERDWKIFLRGHTAGALIKKFQRAEFKRYQCPPVLRISNWSFGRSWSMPIATEVIEP